MNRYGAKHVTSETKHISIHYHVKCCKTDVQYSVNLKSKDIMRWLSPTKNEQIKGSDIVIYAKQNAIIFDQKC